MEQSGKNSGKGGFDEFVIVTRLPSSQVALVAQSLLGLNGIRSFLRDDNAISVYPLGYSCPLF